MLYLNIKRIYLKKKILYLKTQNATSQVENIILK